MNKIFVYGRVSTDVETRENNGRNVANFNVAAQNKNKIGEENGKPKYGTNFYRVSAWGQNADTASRFLKKGNRVTVSGDLVIREYVGNDQLKHTSVEINNADVELVETRAESEAKANAPTQASAPVAQSVPQGFTAVETDEGLPF